MFKNKLFLIIVSMLIVITLILTAAFVLWNFLDKKQQPADPNAAAKKVVEAVKPSQLSSTEVKDLTVTLKDATTNLSDNYIVRATFAFELDNKKVKTEFTDLDFKVKGMINKTLADMTNEQIQGSKGQDTLISTLLNQINPILSKGKVKQIWITDIIVSQG